MKHRQAWEEWARKAGHLTDSPSPSSTAPRARVPVPQLAKASALEHELFGHLTVMQLAPVPQFKFHPERRWRFDFGFPAELVVVDIDGGIFAAENGATAGRHARGAGIMGGFEKRNAAAELGFCVLCYGPPQIRSGEAAVQIERIVSARRGVPPLSVPRSCPGSP
jgi:hypothetical protein